jgi:hypothetical protein
MKCKLCGKEKVLWDTIVNDKKVYDDLCYNCVDKIYMAVAGESCSILGGLIHDYSILESDHNLLIKDKERMFTDMQKEIKFQSDARERLVKKLELYKKALELACETIRQMVGKPYYICGDAIADRLGIPPISQVKDFDYFIKEAKEEIDDSK